jgi:Ribonuclease G/E
VICPVCLGYRENPVYDAKMDVTNYERCDTCDGWGIVLMTKKVTYQKINGNTEHS